MHGTIRQGRESARNANVKADSESEPRAASSEVLESCVNLDADWFVNACKGLFQSKAGTALHYASGFEERSCQRYAAGHTTPTIHFLRALMRSPQGRTWQAVIMDGCDAEWWREDCEDRAIGAAAKAKFRELKANT